VKIVDVNVLLYAVDRSAVHHAKVLRWWNAALAAPETLGLPWITLTAFIRLATRPGIFARPLPLDAALALVDEWLAMDQVTVVAESERHWRLLHELLREAGAAGNLTTDAHLAAIAIGHAAKLVSCDADFGRFRGLRWVNPLA
jgi:toxin-antitoxin system PIN domain toxin